MIANKNKIKRRKTRRVVMGKESLSGKAYEQIRNEILQGDLALGAILSRRRLADKLNMSFLPITEALQRLEAEGLVESRPRIGTRVRVPSKEDILDSYVIREALETQAARLACEQMTAEDRKQLTRSAQHLDSLYEASSTEKDDSRFLFSVHTYHMQFHMQVAQLTRCSGLVRALDKEHVLVFNWLYDTTAQRKTPPESFHSTLAKAICSGNPKRADEAMRAHVRYGLESVINSFSLLEAPSGWRYKRGDS